MTDIKTKRLPKILHNYKAIILDGSEWKLKIDVQDVLFNYSWKAPTKNIAIFVPLIEMMIQCCMTKSKRNIGV